MGNVVGLEVDVFEYWVGEVEFVGEDGVVVGVIEYFVVVVL